MALRKYLSAVLISFAVGIVLLMAVSIQSFLLENDPFFSEHSDIFYKMFGQFRTSIAAMLYLKADRYFHGGTQHEHAHELHSCLMEPDADKKEQEHHHTSSHKEQEHHHTSSHQEHTADIFFRINRAIRYKPVHHLNNVESAEIMPWFELASLADPHYIQAYTVGGFWLGLRLGKVDKALKFLKKGLKYNPNAWEIYAQIGDIYFIANHDYPKAIAYFRQAYLFMNSVRVTDIEKAHVLIFLAVSFERTGDYAHSLQYYKIVRKIHPKDKKIKKTIERLEESLRKR